MRIETLPSPGLLSNGIGLRREAAKAISQIEITAGRTPGGKTINAKSLYDFFVAAAGSVSTLYDVTAATFTGVASSATKIVLTFSETMDLSVTPSHTAFAISGDTITAAEWGSGGDAGKLVLTGTGFEAAESLAYTKPASNYLRDRAGNAVATAAAVVLS